MVAKIIAAIIIGYLLGSIPFAYIMARARKGIDIRKKGSGNIGALAVWREVGLSFGIIALAADVGKGVLTVYIARWLGLTINWICVAGFAAIVGHDWSVFLKFGGGKGAATIMGVLLALMPVQFAISLGVAIIIIVLTNNPRLGMIGLAFIPLIAWLFDRPVVYIYYPLFLVLFLAAYTLIGLRKELALGGERKDLILDRKYNFWQTKKNG